MIMWGEGISCERGTPAVLHGLHGREDAVAILGSIHKRTQGVSQGGPMLPGLQGYLAHKKPPPL